MKYPFSHPRTQHLLPTEEFEALKAMPSGAELPAPVRFLSAANRGVAGLVAMMSDGDEAAREQAAWAVCFLNATTDKVRWRMLDCLQCSR